MLDVGGLSQCFVIAFLRPVQRYTSTVSWQVILNAADGSRPLIDVTLLLKPCCLRICNPVCIGWCTCFGGLNFEMLLGRHPAISIVLRWIWCSHVCKLARIALHARFRLLVVGLIVVMSLSHFCWSDGRDFCHGFRSHLVMRTFTTERKFQTLRTQSCQSRIDLSKRMLVFKLINLFLDFSKCFSLQPGSCMHIYRECAFLFDNLTEQENVGNKQISRWPKSFYW